MAETTPGPVDSMTTCHSPLLSLPPEVRNIIYRYSLVEGVIYISPGQLPPATPGLLEVSRQVRQEAIKVYFKENTFTWYIDNLDAETFIKWRMSSKERKHATANWFFGRHYNWTNLLNGLKAIYYGKPGGPSIRTAKQCEGSAGVLLELTKVVRRMREEQGLSWAQVRAHLENMHLALAAVDPQWA